MFMHPIQQLTPNHNTRISIKRYSSLFSDALYVPHSTEALMYNGTHRLILCMLACFCFDLSVFKVETKASKHTNRKTPHTRLYQPHAGYRSPAPPLSSHGAPEHPLLGCTAHTSCVDTAAQSGSPRRNWGWTGPGGGPPLCPPLPPTAAAHPSASAHTLHPKLALALLFARVKHVCVCVCVCVCVSRIHRRPRTLHP